MEEYQPITDELRLFILFNELDRLIYLLQSRQDNGIIPTISGKHAQALLKELGRKRTWALSQLQQFGVESLKESGASLTEEYRAWFRWWKDYLFSLTEEDRLQIMDGSKTWNQRPSGSWKDLIGTC
jgi:hypothetical protein